MANKKPNLTDEQKQLANDCTKLQRETVINIECHGMNQTEAYIAAGGKAKKPETQRASVSEILTNPNVIAFKDSLVTESLSKAIMTREEALERLSLHARIKITDICTFKTVELKTPDDEVVLNTVWEMKNAEDIDPDIAACIKSVTFTKSGPKIELYDANGSIKQLSDMQGWNAAQKFDHSSTDGSMATQDKELTDDELAEEMQKRGLSIPLDDE